MAAAAENLRNELRTRIRLPVAPGENGSPGGPPWRHFKVVAIDFDGTLADKDGRIGAEVRQALGASRGSGTKVVIVTGRTWADLVGAVPDVATMADAIVAENGAVLVLQGVERPLAAPVDPDLAARLRSRGLSVKAGRVLLACSADDAPVVLHEIQQIGIDCKMVRNRSSLMILPAGISKGTGLSAVLGHLRISRHNTVAVGDAENDLSLFATCELGIAVANAVPQVREHADVILREPNGPGIIELLRSPMVAGGQRVPPTRWTLTLGLDETHATVSIPASQVNVLVTGASNAGKSYVTGLIAEQLLDLSYSVLLIDPEGDHVGLAETPGVLVVGGASPLVPPDNVVQMLTHRFGSVVVDLSRTERPVALEYLRALRRAVDQSRANLGLPHWVLVDEAHWLGERPGIVGGLFDRASTGHCLATYRPEDLTDASLHAIDVILAVPGADRVLAATISGLSEVILGLDAGEVSRALEMLPRRALLVLSRQGMRHVVDVAPRRTAHVRHWHKYATGAIPADKRFYFDRGAETPTGQTACNLAEFRSIIATADEATLRHHLSRRDFSRWIADVIADVELAAAIAVAEQQWLGGDHDCQRARRRLEMAIARRYQIGSPATAVRAS